MLGNLYSSRFHRYGVLADINRAVEFHNQAVHLTPSDNPGKPGLFNSLGIAHIRRFERYGELIYIDKAIECQSRAVHLASDRHPYKPIMLSNLGASHVRRFESHGKLADLDTGIEYQSRAVQSIHEGHPDKPGLLNNLGISYMRRFERHGELAEIATSIECQSQAVRLTPDGHPNKPTRLNSLGDSHMRRFERHGELADIDTALKCQSQALQLTSGSHPGRPNQLNSLGNSHTRRFERYGEMEDLETAIKCQSQAVWLTPDGHTEKPSWLNSLGVSHTLRFMCLGKLTDINTGIKCQSQAVRITPDGQIHKPARLSDLGNSYVLRFERHGEPDDIEKAIECHSQAVNLTPDGHPEKPSWISNLGLSHLRRSERSGEPADLDTAIKYQIQAVQLTPDRHPHKPGCLNNLGTSYVSRFSRHGVTTDVEKGIEYHNQAIRLTPDGHPSKSGYFNNLGSSYMRRFERHGGLADVEKAIECHSQAVQLAADSHPDRANMLNNLGISHLGRFDYEPNMSDLTAACTSFQQAAQFVVGNPYIKFKAACAWARCCSLLGISPLLAYHGTMELVPQLVWLGTTITRRYELLMEIGNVSMEAACCAISRKAYDRALEWLEEGRSVVWNQKLQLRTPFDDLQTVDPSLADRLKEVARYLEHVGSRSAVIPLLGRGGLDLGEVAHKHYRLATEWDQLLEKARQLPGFDDFLRPRKAAALMHAAKDGPVIVINVHKTRCDALLIQPYNKHIAHVPLCNFSQEKASDCRAQLMTLFGDPGYRTRWVKLASRVQRPGSFERTLASLWSDLVLPIADFLRYTGKPSIEELPHVTWCTTGSLSFLPLHAAGCYDGSQPKAFDLFVSSYTPTLSALLASPPILDYNHGMLTVSQEYTKGLSHLPNTIRELAVIEQHVRGIRYFRLDGENATTSAVLKAMGEYSWVHFACHATQNQEDPSQSAFHLCDGKLALSTITQKSFKDKGLAFLSACQTATGDEKLPDESVHLAAGMLIAGYPSVIATMWSIQDEDGPEVARDVYGDLLKGGRMDCTRASRALHKAIAGLRAKVGERSFERWAPFVHMGL